MGAQALGLLASKTLDAVADFFRALSFPVEVLPSPWEFEDLPESARRALGGTPSLVAEVFDPAGPFRVFDVPLETDAVRTAVRAILTPFYRRFPQGDNLFVFRAPAGLWFVFPHRIRDPRDEGKVRLLLRYLEVHPDAPYRTETEVAEAMRLREGESATAFARRLAEAFSCERVSDAFYRDFQAVFERVKGLVVAREEHHQALIPEFVHLLMNRLMFLYFVARKGLLLGPSGSPSRRFLLEVWQAYQEGRKAGRLAPDTFYDHFLRPIFFEAFCHRFKPLPEYRERFPDWLVESLRVGVAPFLNGGLFHERQADQADLHVPDGAFHLLFDYLPDGTTPGLFERYHFTITETSRFDEEVAVDPEVIGRVYESLVNRVTQSERDVRTEAGVFYTPRTEIDLMCRLALLEHLSRRLGLDEGHRRILTEFVFAFDPEEVAEASRRVTEADLWPALDSALRKVRVLDPAVGSGSFLVGMLLILDELQARCDAVLHGGAERPFDRRRRIIAEQLYGVDCLEWAARVAELRLWLQLVVETPLKPEELTLRPLLPNLDFHVRVGDSLIQTIGSLDVTNLSVRSDRLSTQIKGRITAFAGLKARHCLAEDGAPGEAHIRQEEAALYHDILENLKARIEQDLQEVQQTIAQGGRDPRMLGGLGATAAERSDLADLESKKARLERERDLVNQALEAFRAGEPLPFVFDIAFAEVVKEGGFDIIIGNPPYVCNEDIADPFGRFGRDDYIARIHDSVRAAWPNAPCLKTLSRRNDYLVYFYLLLLRRLSEKGAFCFITSNSWLDVKYGKDLQEFLLRHAHLRLVVENRARRSFARADVNTVITLVSAISQSPLSNDEMGERPVRFVTFRCPFEEAMNAVIVEEIEEASDRTQRAEFRVVVKDQATLLREGMGDQRAYQSQKWGGKYLRAPDIYFTILEKGRGKLVPLGEVAEVRFGIKTGANEFFYLEPVGQTVKEVAELREKNPSTPVQVRNAAGWEGEIEAAWLRPVIKSPREIKTLRVRLEDLRYLVFMAPEDVREAMDRSGMPPLYPYPKASAYIEWGEARDYHDRETCASRRRWWDLGKWETPALFWSDAYNHRFPVPVNDANSYGDKRFFFIYTEDESVSAYLATSVTPLLIELGGIANLGEGVIYTNVYWLAGYQTISSKSGFPLALEVQLVSAFDRLSRRPVRSIFEELGFALCRERRCQHPEHPYEHVEPEDLTLDQVARASPDRFALDSVVFDILGLDDGERLAVYRAVADLVKTRLVKARSTRNG